MKHKILCVDDEPDILQALERMLRKDYEILTATSGAEGLEILKNEKVSLIISDQRMPEMTGVEFLKQSISIQQEPMRVLLTGYTDVESIVNAVNQGEIYRYLTKPWDPVDLLNTIKQAIDTYELTAEIKQKNIELKLALDELKTLDQTKTQFMYLVNHELKTPLTVITSFLALLSESKLDEEQSLYVNKIDQSNQRLTRIVEDVLELVSAETGVLEFKPAAISAIDLLKGIDQIHDAEANKKQQKLLLELDDMELNADRNIIHKVLNKLVNNALKFAPDGAEIRIKAQMSGEGKFISVCNPGDALPQESINKILKPFSLDEDILHHSTGLGLGLSLCQALLKRHNTQLKFDHLDGRVIIGFQL